MSYELWGEVLNDREAIAAIKDLSLQSGAAPVIGSWNGAHIPYSMVHQAFSNTPGVFVGDIRMSVNGMAIANSAYSVYKITYCPFHHYTPNQDDRIVGANYGCGTIMGANMAINAVPNTASTNGQYTLQMDYDPYAIGIWASASRVGMMKGSILFLFEGQWQAILWYNDAYYTVRMWETGI